MNSKNEIKNTRFSSIFLSLLLNCYTKYKLLKDGSLKVIGTCSVNGTDYMIDNKTISKLEYEKEIESYIGKQAVKMEFYK